jgi:hypothetical protein
MNLMQMRTVDRIKTDLAVVNKQITGAPIVTNAQAQEWCKTDANLTSLIASVSDYAERETGMAFRAQTVTAVYLSCDKIFDLPIRGALAISSITDKDGNVVSATEYELVGDTVLLREPRADKTTIVYTAQFQSDAVELAILKLTLSHFEDRQDNVVGTIVQEMKNSSKAILRPFMRY